MGLLGNTWSYLCMFGLRATLVRTVEKFGQVMERHALVRPEQQVSSTDLLSALSRNLGQSPDDHPYVDIVIPVFNGLAMLQRCMESILRNSSKCHLILIDDASTDVAVWPYLVDICCVPDRSVTAQCLRNDVCLGFVGTVNRGLRMATHDVVVLNADTEVPPRWLERLLAPIVADPERVASVTPMSNRAAATGFPEPQKDNEAFLGLTPDVLDNYFARWGRSGPIDIAVGDGYCMSRRALDAVGDFDKGTFGRGHGEGSDWCVRARRSGFRNVAIANLFVYHQHCIPPTEEKALLASKHQRTVETRCPETVQQFDGEDPLWIDRAALAWLIALSEPRDVPNHAVVDIDMEDAVGGSIEYRRWLVHSIVSRGDRVVQFLGTVRSHAIRVLIEGPQGSVQLLLDEASERDIGTLIGAAGVSDILVNGLITYAHPDDVAAQLASRPEAKVFAVHDYTTCCPSPTLLNSHGMWCHGETDLDTCGRCLGSPVMRDSLLVPVTTTSDMTRWRQAMRRLLDSCSSIVCFSSVSERQLQHVYPGISRVKVIEHTLREPASFARREIESGSRQLVVATIGSMSPAKGHDIVSRAATLAASLELPIQFCCIGQWAQHVGALVARNGRLRVTGAYRRQDLPRLLEESGASLVVIPSILPETFSYATSEAMLLGYPVVCFDLGAPAERVRTFDCGMVVKDVSAEGMLAALKHILEHPELVEYWSRNTARYRPPTEAEHTDAILRCLREGSRRGDDRLAEVEEPTA
jgi:GT2 family glycosyltransferase